MVTKLERQMQQQVAAWRQQLPDFTDCGEWIIDMLEHGQADDAVVSSGLQSARGTYVVDDVGWRFTDVDVGGFNPGPIDGELGSQTYAAIAAYQRSKNLPTGGLTMNTLKSLGVAVR